MTDDELISKVIDNYFESARGKAALAKFDAKMKDTIDAAVRTRMLKEGKQQCQK